MFMAEDEEAGALLGRRPILRAPPQPPRLGPLEILAPWEAHGRLIGMLPRRRAQQ